MNSSEGKFTFLSLEDYLRQSAALLKPIDVSHLFNFQNLFPKCVPEQNASGSIVLVAVLLRPYGIA